MVKFNSTLLQHQKEQLRFHLEHPHSANWSEMGTGKTVIALKLVVDLKRAGLVKRTLVICPLSVFPTWEIEIAKHTDMSCIPLTGTLQNKVALLEQDADVYLISYDAIPGRRTKKYDTHGIMMGALFRREFDQVIADEVTMIKGYGTLRTRAVTILCDKTPFTLFMSGTPISNNPADIFNIYRAMDGGETFGRNFYASRNRYFENVGWAYPKYEIRPDMKDALHQKMYESAVRVRKDDCLDLPPKIFSPRFCYLTQHQKDYYIPIVEDLLKVLELDTGNVKIKTALTKLTKLQQITSGFLYTDDKTFYFDDNPKAELVLELVKENPDEKIIIYGYWQEDIHILNEMLKLEGLSTGTLYGATPSKERKRLVTAFQQGDLQILIANIGVGGYGLTLTSSSTIIYYDFSFKVIDFLQSQDRIHRHGQAKTCLYLPLLTKGTVDEYVYHSILKNTAIAESLVDGVHLKDSIRRFLRETNS